MKRLLVILFSVTFLFSFCNRKSTDLAQLGFDNLIKQQFQSENPGVVALVVKNGKVLYSKALGMANMELGVPMDTGNIFRIGSITKQFTACAILKLEEQGKLNLNDDITRFIPDYPTYGIHISIENLLTHTSGIKSFTGMKEWTSEFQKNEFAPLDFIHWFWNQPLEFKPGAEFRYNNSGYFILGYIIEKVSGKRYPEYLRDEFFTPLGLKNTRYDTSAAIIPHRAAGYEVTNGKYENMDYISMSQPFAAGGLVSSARDLYLWTKALENGRVISKESLQKARKAYILNDGKATNYGYGWFLLNVKGIPTVEHGGGINGFTTYCLYVPSKDIFVALLSNTGSGNVADLSVKLAAAAMNAPYQFIAINLPYDSLFKYQGVYAHDSDEAVFRVKDSCLCGWIKGSKRLVFKSSAKDGFFVRESFTSVQFSRNTRNEIDSVVTSDRSAIIHWKRTNKALPEEKFVLLPESILLQYVGSYKLTSDFVISIKLKDKKLFAEGSGQEAFPIIAKSNSMFVNEDGDIQFEFCKNTAGKVSKLKLYQNERVMMAEKMR